MKQAALKVLAVAGAALLAAAVLSVPGLLINWYESRLAPGVQLVPWLWDLRAALEYLPIGAAGIVGVWLFTRGRTVLASPSRARHFAKLILLLLWAFAAAGAGFTAILFTSDDFIFPTTQPSASVRIPHGKRTAHLIADCFFGCTLAYAIEEQGAWSMPRTPVLGFSSNVPQSDHPTLQWSEEGKIRFVGGGEAFKALAGRSFPEEVSPPPR